MKIIDGIDELKLPGRGQIIIPDCWRDDLPEFFKEMGFTTGVEIGVDQGLYSKKLCQAGLTVFGVDPYLIYEGFIEHELQEKMDRHERDARRKLAKHSNFTMIKKMSMDAVKDFENESIDFVFIDGNHGFKFVTEDIYEWSKKVRKGGVIAGHDYIYDKDQRIHHQDVKYVVHAYTRAIKLKRWYVLGSDEKLPGKKRDRSRSWMWIKE